LKTGRSEEFLKFETDWLGLCKLWRITIGPTYFAVITSLPKGKALAEFELHTNQAPEAIQNERKGAGKGTKACLLEPSRKSYIIV